jgi:hypothetical protein
MHQRQELAHGCARPRSSEEHEAVPIERADANHPIAAGLPGRSKQGKNRYASNKIIVQVPWELLDPGPTGKKIAVINYDAGGKCYYSPIDLEDRLLLANHGLDPSEGDHRFHQQIVYAIASRTIHMFEAALGHDIHWRRADQANAYYSPRRVEYCSATSRPTKRTRAVTCPASSFSPVSQDIIAHEVTYAVIDRHSDVFHGTHQSGRGEPPPRPEP